MSRRGTTPPGTYISPAETGLYYLQSRYYDPEIGRFINADAVEYLDEEQSLGTNLFIHCWNDWPNQSDFDGHASWKIVAMGIQLEFDVGPLTIGAEIIISLKKKVYAYIYGGFSLNQDVIKSIVKRLTQLVSSFNPTSLLSFGGSVCLFAVFSRNSFVSGSYKGTSDSVYGVVPLVVVPHVGLKAYYAWSKHYRVAGIGLAVSISPAPLELGYARTTYTDVTPILYASVKFVIKYYSFIYSKIKGLKPGKLRYYRI